MWKVSTLLSFLLLISLAEYYGSEKLMTLSNLKIFGHVQAASVLLDDDLEDSDMDFEIEVQSDTPLNTFKQPKGFSAGKFDVFVRYCTS